MCLWLCNMVYCRGGWRISLRMVVVGVMGGFVAGIARLVLA